VFFQAVPQIGKRGSARRERHDDPDRPAQALSRFFGWTPDWLAGAPGLESKNVILKNALEMSDEFALILERLRTRDFSPTARNTTALATSSGVPNLPSGTALEICVRRCSPTPEEASKSLNPGVSINPGLIAFTRMPRTFRSVVHVRANERTAAFVALYTLLACKPLLATMEAFTMIEASSGISGSAFCTVNTLSVVVP
jgi:hypothetical protein